MSSELVNDAHGDPQAVADHLRALYGEDGGDAPGYLCLFGLPSKSVRVIPGDSLFGNTPNLIAKQSEVENVYHGLGLLSAPPKAGRGKSEDVLAMPALAADIDIAGPNHKGAHYPTTRLEALGFLAELPFQPSMVNDTGGGLHVYWNFRELVVFTNDAERLAFADLSDRVHRAIIAHGAARGWKLDNTGDLARVFRPAGTINHKNGVRRPVRQLWASNARYSPSDFVAFAATAAPSPVARADAKREIVSGSNSKFGVAAPASVRGETVRTIIAAGKAAGYSSDFITDSLDRRIRAYIAKVGQRGEGDRDNTAFRLAAWLLNDFGVSESVALAYLVEWNAKNAPPLADREIKAKLHSAARSGRRPVGYAHADRGSAA